MFACNLHQNYRCGKAGCLEEIFLDTNLRCLSSSYSAGSPDIILSVMHRNIGNIQSMGMGEFQNVICHELGQCGLYSAQPAGWTSDESFDPHWGQRFFRSSQINSGIHPATSSAGLRVSFHGVKWQGHEADQPLHNMHKDNFLVTLTLILYNKLCIILAVWYTLTPFFIELHK